MEPSVTPIDGRSVSGPVVCNWHTSSAGSTAHGSTPDVWFASAHQTSYDRIEGVWTAEVQYRAASEHDARVIAERMIAAAGGML